MTIAWKKAYVKWGKQEYNAMPKAVSGPCVESNFLSLETKPPGRRSLYVT